MIDVPYLIAFAIVFVFVVMDKVHVHGIIEGQQKTIKDLSKKVLAKNLAELSQFNEEELKMNKKIAKVVVDKNKTPEKETLDQAIERLRDTQEIV